MTYLAFLTVPIVYIFLFKTPLGLRIRAVGEEPNAAASLGTNVFRIRFIALLASGVLAGFGGMYMSMGYLPYFTRDMVAGRGFISIAAHNLGGYMPFATMVWSLVFGITGALSNTFQIMNVPPEFLQMFPYLSTLFGLALVGIIENGRNKRLKSALKDAAQNQGKFSNGKGDQ